MDNGPAVEIRGHFAGVGIDIVDVANVAVVDFLIVIVLDLHDLVARGAKREVQPDNLSTLASPAGFSAHFAVRC